MAYTEGNFRTFIVGATQIPAYTAVKVVSGLLVAAAAATDVIVGLTPAIGYVGQPIDVRLRSSNGTANAIAGATINANDALTTNASGQLIPTTTAGNQVVGYAIAAATTGGLVEVELTNTKY